MAAGKEIRVKIKSVEGTKKITKAMEMVAASKMRKAQERMRAARPYAERVRSLAANLSHATPEYKHPFMVANDGRQGRRLHRRHDRQGAVRRPEHERAARDHRQAQGARRPGRRRPRWCAIGSKGLGFMNRIGAKVVSHVTQLGDRPQLDKLIGPVKVLLDAYAAGKLSAVYLCYTRFINTMRQEPVIQQLLPLSGEQHAEGRRQARLGLHLRARRARSSSTSCCCATSRRSSTRRRPRTRPPSSRRGWSR